MKIKTQIVNGLESRWLAPAYSGWLLGGLALFFFMAATNTLSGWLYVISGVMAALLAIAAALSARNLQNIQVVRRPIYPVSAGDDLTVELLVQNGSSKPKSLLQVSDLIPHVLGEPITKVVEILNTDNPQYWVYQIATRRRGVYQWQTVQVRSAAPLGLFWGRRSQTVAARAIVYPTVLPLSRCPLVDDMGRESSLQINSDRRAQSATEGITRSLRPYRWGDSTRLIHWRSSARYGELRIRELERFTGGQELIVCLDSAASWSLESFEEAVIAAASLYFYAAHQHLNIRLWTARTGLIQGEKSVLEVLAAVDAGEEVQTGELPRLPLVWLTQNSASLPSLPEGSRWVLWQPELHEKPIAPGILIRGDRALQAQLQDAPGF
ncbi:MAG: DUF58 domain-containing protein [Leptolyngbyaceae cyanobacterium CSU_1_3]|nr:DUF58 domain-containing protein [Leptolyngbyaceae cyanobacterium CSU_1_3]